MNIKLPADHFYHYIDGELEEGNSRTERVCCPGNEEWVADVKLADGGQAARALEAAERAFPMWSSLSLEERGSWVSRLQQAIMDEKENLLTLLLLESGKLRSHAQFETDSLINYLGFFMEQAKCSQEEILRDISGGHGMYMTVREPLGVVVAALAWNFPMHNVATKIGPILASGCTAVIKPATKTPLSTMYLGSILKKIGFPKGVLNFIAGDAGEIGKVLCKSKIPAMITMIGSTQGGLHMIKDSTTSVKRFSMELGGNAPVIVTASADLKAAAAHTIGNKMRCAGQTCVSPQRVYVQSRVYDAFLKECIEMAVTARCGMMDEDANTGALISADAVERMEAIVADALAMGARVECGGRKPEEKEKGYYYLPTILTEVTDDMEVIKEEVFGPIVAIMPYEKQGEALKRANDSRYGLTSYIWARDYNEIAALTRGLEAGIVNVNGPGTGAPYPHGGCKDSGIGKDGSVFSLEEYYYVKGIRIALK
ncbi:aldehyde dehydrogenase family protein [[Clostridium] symbiosum]|uniref:aldehyde dehydrogenase family protein n=1 Tax=Clostridium symbiosum TaxID=1512 RepID=UPI001D0829AA|nr:aldehyde dehydrogenase family protein [[Clostridium] symbiosum]MCB6610705.1 aldehyde dehydrogenase family protein [[Clostridium] symbiosum]MCB6931315.1 aldehyde dehydrogenase family protein [[Clostridium] symbiosum]